METESMKEVLKFTCPECGSNKFGSSNCTAEDIADMIGLCHGTVQTVYGSTRSCNFTWSRADDAKYFTRTGDLMPASIGAIVAGREVDG